VDNEIAYLTGNELIKTPMAAVWKVEEFFPFNLKELNRRLRKKEIGEVVIKKRGTAVEPEIFRKKLKPVTGGRKVVIFLTLLSGKQSIIICRELRENRIS